MGFAENAVDLDEQAFLERACADAGGVELLEHGECVGELLGADVDVVVEEEVVDDVLEGAVDESAVVERADEVLDELALEGCDVVVGDLCFEVFDEGACVADGNFGLGLASGRLIDGQVVGVVEGGVRRVRRVRKIRRFRKVRIVGGFWVFRVVGG